MPPPPTEQDRRTARAGVAFGIGAYLWWGLAPLYFKAVAVVEPLEVLAHRIVWSVLMLGAFMSFGGRWTAALDLMKNRRTQLTLVASTCFITTNWFGFIYVIWKHQILQASLGYFINPLVNVLFGFLFLRERLRRAQGLSVLLAAGGVGYLVANAPEAPWMAVMLAVSFAFYGLLRKTAKVDSLTGLTLETLLLLPLALGYMAWSFAAHRAQFVSGGSWISFLLVCAGPVTAIPLLWFASAARRVRLATMGFMQYIAPSFQFAIAVLGGEKFTPAHGVAFACIWTALLVYTIDAVWKARGDARALVAGAP